MKHLSLELKTGIVAPAIILVFAAIMALISPPASADFIDDTRSCFPNCSASKAAENTLEEDLKWLCAESGRKDC